MALKKKLKPNVEKPSENGKYFTISISKKKKILGILLIVISFFIILSILSYSRSDEARLSSQIWSDLQNVISNANTLSNQPAEINNWMGIAGVYISFFFIRSMIGYFSILLPAVIFLWGLRFFKRLDFRILIHLSNFFLLSGLILSSFFGVLSLHSESIHNNEELFGNVGKQLGMIFNRFLGGIGSVIFLLALMIAILIFAFDIKIENIFRFIMNLFNKSVEKIKNEYETGKLDSKQEANLEKIKSLREDKKNAIPDRKSTRLNSSHRCISYAVFCL